MHARGACACVGAAMCAAVPIAPAGARARTPSPPPAPAAQRDVKRDDDVSPWSSAYTPIRVPASATADMRDLTFTYLYEQKVYRQKSGPLHTLPSLRCLARACRPKVVQEGSKRDLVCRLMLRVSENVAAETQTWESAFEPHRSDYFSIVRHELGLRPMFYAPSHRQLLAGMPAGKERARRAKRVSSPPVKDEPPPPKPPDAPAPHRAITNSEFARLMALIATRSLRVAPRQPESFWVSHVERDFNSAHNQLALDVSCALSDSTIDASRAPLTFRSATVLRHAYNEVAELFTSAFRSWTGTRASRAAFASFVNASAGSAMLSDVGKRCCVMFAAFRCGLPDELTDLTAFVWERAPTPAIPLALPLSPTQTPAPSSKQSSPDPASAPLSAVLAPRGDGGARPPKRRHPDASPSAGPQSTDARTERLVSSVASSTVAAAVAAALSSCTHKRARRIANAATDEATLSLDALAPSSRHFLNELVSTVATAAVSAAVSASITATQPPENADVASLISKLKMMLDLKCDIGVDLNQPQYMAQYVQSEIVRLRALIENAQAQTLPHHPAK